MSLTDIYGQPIPNSSWSKMSPVCCQAIQDTTSLSSSMKWSKGGVLNLSHGEYWTVNSSEFPKDAEGCSLSAILEANVPEKYSLSQRACEGILRRAEKRGKSLPPTLRQALTQVAGGTGTT